MLVFHQSNLFARMRFYYGHIPIFVFFLVFVCSLLLSCMHMSNVLHVKVKTLRNQINF